MKTWSKKARVIVGTLSLSLSFLAVTACGTSNDGSGDSSASPSGVTNIVFWDLFGGADGTTMHSIVQEFNKTHSKIHIQEETQDWNQYYTKLTASVLGGKSPDFAISHVDHLAILQTQGVIQPLDQEAQAAGIDWSQFFKPAMKDAVIDGKHYAIPLDVHTDLLFYNKKVLKASGISPDNLKISSYDQFVKILQQIKTHNYVPLAFTESGWEPMAMWETFYEQLGGGPLVNDSRTQEVFTDSTHKSTAVAAMQKLYDLYNTYQVIPSNISSPDQLFKSGKAAFHIGGTWNVDSLNKTLGSDLGVAQMPTLFNQPAAWANSHTFILPKNPQRTPEQTKDAMIFVKWVEDNAWLWAKAGHIPANTNIQNTSQYKELPFRSNYGSQASFVSYFPMTNKVWMQSDHDLRNVVQGILLKKIPVDQGVQQMGDMINQKLH